MNIWIVTIGSSDVQLDSNSECRKKGRNENHRSDKVWRYWYEDEIKADCCDISFEPKQSYKDNDEPYRIEARILGTVYEASSPTVRDEILSYLTFPLLERFVGELKNYPPDAIAVLLTDQSEIFQDNHTRGKPKCAYWQDTCKLEPILQRYFQDKFPQAKYTPIFLSPTSSDRGLDDWNYVLDLVREKLRAIEFDGEAIEHEEIETVYVSHQAGTPAISSAVQFVSLASFRSNVQFLVNNEYSQETRTISRSTYLGAIQIQKAKALLDRHDYAGVKELVSSYLTPENQILLDAAIQWNFAKFDDFAQVMTEASEKYSKDNEWWRTFDADIKVRANEWWWTAYESAYLAVVRLKQGNTVEAMFHSFRAVEGLLAKWVYQYNNVKKQGKKFTKQGKKIKLSQAIAAPWNNTKTTDEFNSYGQGLYWTLEFFKGVDKNKDTEFDIWEFGNYVFDIRNSLFHNLEGLKDKEAVFKAWKISDNDEQKWQKRVLSCLNFIAKEDLPKKFTSLEEASLLFKVHEKLGKAIGL